MDPPQKIASANIPLAALGALLLYLGWFGFNGGSTLALPTSTTEHEQIMIVHQNGKVALVNPYDLGSPIGINTALVGHLHFHFQPIAGVVLFSSGMRQISTNADPYGLEHIQPVVQRYWNSSANAIAAEVMTDISQMKRTSQQSVPNDLTLLVLKQK